MARTFRRFIWRFSCALMLSFPGFVAMKLGMPVQYGMALLLAGGFLMPPPPKDW